MINKIPTIVNGETMYLINHRDMKRIEQYEKLLLEAQKMLNKVEA